ncbi:hypothetical protein [Polynucleobacter sphagniphilus]|uniref:Uncharacterized protein n=1 Tax=Polynucleobacter sphagniphilus TaxID=1743169 RepID=A0AA43MC44_9BURK|nr:hypothetical protein [Polynucleobacter sphagniphilus]MDH6504977.1 hypothetical protein [Polynucleobacter sphagniphilus]MDH6513545.1 hypothetical protein [Polynucleobacter sphagniphilus]
MKKNQAITSVAALLMLLSIGIANAQGYSNSSRLVTNVTDQVTDLLSAASYQGGNISNISINTADIKSRVDITGANITTGGSGASASAASSQILTSSQLNTNDLSNQSSQSKINQLSGAGNSSTTNNIASTASTASANITATAIDNNFSATSIGAMNSGNIDITQASTNGKAGNLSIEGLSLDSHSQSVSAGQLELLNGYATFNPSVANLAINTSAISSEVKVNASADISLANTSISAASVGAMNTGNITVTAPTPAVSTGHH